MKNWPSPSFYNTTLQNFQGISDLLPIVSNFQHHKKQCSKCNTLLVFFFLWRCDLTRVMASSFLRFLEHTQRRTTVGRTPLDEWSACLRDLYLTAHNTHNRQHIHSPGGIRTHDFSRRAAADLRLRRRGHWDRQHFTSVYLNKCRNFMRRIQGVKT